MGDGYYFNFDLRVEKVGKKYCARVIDSPAGHASVEFGLPFSKLELENFVLRMGKSSKGARRLNSYQMEAAKQVGERLFQAIFKETLYTCFQRSKDIAFEQEKGLRVRLRIDVPEFHCFPWEYLYDAQANQFLALSRETPIVRYLELSYSVRPFPVTPPLNILVMISCPESFPQLDVEKEWENLNIALEPLISRGLVSLVRLENPTLGELQKQLRRGEYHVFHFIGHGSFLMHKQDGVLLLEEEVDGRGRPVSGQYLGTILHDHRSLRLVVLNACEGARTSPEDPYAGVAQTLLRQGVPAVIAMQFEIFEDAAIAFAREFYGAIADGYPVDAAVSEARKAIFAGGNETEWGTPVLFMYAPNGKIFDLDRSQILMAKSDQLPKEPIIGKPEKKGSLSNFGSKPPEKPPRPFRFWFFGGAFAFIIMFAVGYWLLFLDPDKDFGSLLEALFRTPIPTSSPTQTKAFTPSAIPSATNTPTVISPIETMTLTPPPTRISTSTPSPTPSVTPLPVEITVDGVTMVLIPAGEFTMGNNNGKTEEQPAHPVSLDSFYIDKYEVTNNNYKKCVQENNCEEPIDLRNFQGENYFYNAKYSDYPVIFVSWEMTKTYCEWRGARLPTEAEWEKAARGTGERTYPWGEEFGCEYANFHDDKCGRIKDTTTVTEFGLGQSVYGVFNMAGNVWEWVADWYSASYYKEYTDLNTKTPPEGPSNGARRVIRGGGFNTPWESFQITNRTGRDPTSPGSHVGFRCARSVSTDFP